MSVCSRHCSATSDWSRGEGVSSLIGRHCASGNGLLFYRWIELRICGGSLTEVVAVEALLVHLGFPV